MTAVISTVRRGPWFRFPGGAGTLRAQLVPPDACRGDRRAGEATNAAGSRSDRSSRPLEVDSRPEYRDEHEADSCCRDDPSRVAEYCDRRHAGARDDIAPQILWSPC